MATVRPGSTVLAAIGMELVTMFFRGKDECEAYLNAQRQNADDLK